MTGLTSGQVEETRRRGEVNRLPKRFSKPVKKIIFDNIVNYFNILTVVIFIITATTGSFENALFIGVVFSNAFMGILQEIRAKRTVDKLSILTAATAEVIRDGMRRTIGIEEIVKGDYIIFSAGQQISVDAKVISSDNLEVNESLITGESDAVYKRAGDNLLSGSFVVAGEAIAEATAVGMKSYASSLTAKAKTHKRVHSEIASGIDKILKYMSIIIVPIGVFLFCAHYLKGVVLTENIIASAGAIIGMIPSGLVLITTITMAVGVIRSARHRVIVNEPPAIESLARVDTLCLDKTGTLTDGSFKLEKTVPLSGFDISEIGTALAAICGAFENKNASLTAIEDSFGTRNVHITAKLPFSSERKMSSITVDGEGTYILGAPEVVFKDFDIDHISYAQEGYRVLALSFCRENEEIHIPMALILIADNIRDSAKETLRYFASYGVDIKLISGDNPVTVSNIAQRLSLAGYEKYIDMSQFSDDDERIYDIATEYTVFGRVSPNQKQHIVKALQNHGKTVAMTGDGVNDVLALQQSDCGVAMASGSDAAKGVAKLVMVDCDFSSLPHVIAEGRTVINNLENVSSLYLVKTMFSAALSFFYIFFPGKYPIAPVHLTLIGAVSVGIPSFLLALEKNTKLITNGFLKRAFKKSIPGALLITVNVIAFAFMHLFGKITEPQLELYSVWLTGIISIAVLFGIARPINLFRGAVASVMAFAYFLGFVILRPFMEIIMPSPADLIVLFVLSVLYFTVIFYFTKGKIKKILKKY